VPLGTVDEGTRYDDPTDGELSFRTDGRCASVSFPIGAISSGRLSAAVPAPPPEDHGDAARLPQEDPSG
jgi:hypothetical protein